jgi:hypothetical protein
VRGIVHPRIVLGVAEFHILLIVFSGRRSASELSPGGGGMRGFNIKWSGGCRCV